MQDSLRDREIILAGGSGGLGQAIARLLAAEGARLIVSFRSNRERAESLRPLAREIVAANLTVAADRARLLDAAPQLYGLVILAGEPARVPDPAQFEDVFRRSLEVNLLGPLALAREAAERMKAAGTAGAIVLFSTMQAVGVFPGSLAYAAPKAGLLHAARVLAKEYRGRANIRINVVCPGVTQAGMAEASIAAGKYDRYLAEGIIPRFGRALDVARAVRFFLEPDNYVTGQFLLVDGGLTL